MFATLIAAGNAMTMLIAAVTMPAMAHMSTDSNCDLERTASCRYCVRVAIFIPVRSNELRTIVAIYGRTRASQETES